MAGVPLTELAWLAAAIMAGGVVSGVLAGLFGIGGGAVAYPVDGVMLGAQRVEHGFTDHEVVFDKQQAHRDRGSRQGTRHRRGSARPVSAR